ncbi:hypothetical protein [Candidatus Amarolinea aalborgensis]|uniref:hypothetical protein n=1 Tax=Candidatus Amarolinea aalborgensis TaxID=2249329 RepID=UPI003BF9F17B
MFVTTHDVAVYEKFMLVAVELDDVEDIGEDELWDAVEENDWIIAQNKPTVLVYVDSNDDINYYGDEDLVDAAAEVPYDEIVWSQQITLEWLEEGDEEE